MNEEEAKRILMELSTFDYVKLENGDVAIETVLNLLEKKDEWINKLETKLMYALTPTKHELAKRTQEEFKETIRENIDEDTYTIKRKLKENWNNL